MKIRDIILEVTAEDRKKLIDLRNFGNVDLANRIQVYINMGLDWDTASENARIDRKEKAESGKDAFARRRANRATNTTDDQATPAKLQRKDAPKPDGKTLPVDRAGSGWSDETHGHLRRGDGGTIKKALKKLDPTAGLDTTDLGTTIGSAIAKQKSKSKNLDSFKIQK